MSTKVSVLFYAKKSKSKNENYVPIYLRITMGGKRVEVSTGKTVEYSKWNSSSNRMRGNTEESRVINNHLDILKFKILEIEQKLLLQGGYYEASDIKEILLGKRDQDRFLIEIFKEHNSKMEQLIGKEYAKSTLKGFRNCLDHFEKFLWKKSRTTDINIRKVDASFLDAFDFYLRTEAQLCNNTVVKHVKSLGKILKSCYFRGWVEKDVITQYKGKFNNVNVNFLTNEEINILKQQKFKSEGLTLVRDLFIFSCYTGLSYVDVYNLTKDQISVHKDGNKWIMTNRQKNRNISNIPLLKVAEAIISQYQNHKKILGTNRLLPVYSNQEVNDCLKSIANICDISKNLTFHVARHTFATTITLQNKVSIESVSKMLGHKSIRTTQHYAKILDEKVSADMSALAKILQKQDEIKTR